MGRGQRYALILGFLLPPALAQGETRGEVELGSPFAQLAAQTDLSDHWSLGGRLQLVDGRAVRLGPALQLRWPGAGLIQPRTELFLGRSTGLSAVSTWDAELMQEILRPLGEGTSAAVRLGLIGYYGPERTQTGVIGYACLRVSQSLGGGLTLSFELGWMAGLHSHRPRGGIVLGRAW